MGFLPFPLQVFGHWKYILKTTRQLGEGLWNQCKECSPCDLIQHACMSVSVLDNRLPAALGWRTSTGRCCVHSPLVQFSPPANVLYSVGNTLGNTGSTKVPVRSALTSVWGSNLEIISPEDKRERGKRGEGISTARSFCLSWLFLTKDTETWMKFYQQIKL